eukprot:tig00000734_g3759.t1
MVLLQVSAPQMAGNIADSGLSHVFDLQTNPRTNTIVDGTATTRVAGVTVPAASRWSRRLPTRRQSRDPLLPLNNNGDVPTFARWYQTYALNNKNRQSAFVPNGQCSFTYDQFASFYAGSYLKDPESVFFWIEFGIQAAMFTLFLILTLRREEHKRRFHYITTLYSGISTMAYYCMARGQGSVALFDTWSNGDFSPYRVFYYARYIDWFLTVPLIILNLCLLASATKALTIVGWFGISNMCFIPIIVAWVTVLRKNAREKSPEVEKTYNILIIISIIAWFAYPLIWIIATGTHAISLRPRSSRTPLSTPSRRRSSV